MARRTFSEETKQKVIAYVSEHGIGAATQHFKIHDSIIRRWLKGGPASVRKTVKRTSANGKTYYGYPAKRATNGLGTLPEKDALVWLERWRQAYFDRMKAETPTAASVLAALRGEK